MASFPETYCRTPVLHEEERRRNEELRLETEASKPYKQFLAQISDEEDRLYEADRNRIKRINHFLCVYDIAYEIVKDRWVEQGIWNDKWGDRIAYAIWKHEEPREHEWEDKRGFYSRPPEKPQSERDEEKRLEREREASRPYHQFTYQISRERERIQVESKRAKRDYSADINTEAYENVRNIWSKRGIWNKGWGILPGMSWKHEAPLDNKTAHRPALQPNQVVTGSHEVERPLFGMRNLPLGSGNVIKDPGEDPSGSGMFTRKPSVETKDLFGNPVIFPAGNGIFTSPPATPQQEPSTAAIAPFKGRHDRTISGRLVTEMGRAHYFMKNPPVALLNDIRMFGLRNTRQQGLSADIDSAGLEKNNAENSPSAPNSPRLLAGKEVLRKRKCLHKQE